MPPKNFQYEQVDVVLNSSAKPNVAGLHCATPLSLKPSNYKPSSPSVNPKPQTLNPRQTHKRLQHVELHEVAHGWLLRFRGRAWLHLGFRALGLRVNYWVFALLAKYRDCKWITLALMQAPV